MHVARSFDINKPGSGAAKIKGGVIGGTLVQGTFKLGDTIEIRPGITNNNKRITLKSEIIGLEANGKDVEEIGPGGLIGVATKLDPSLTKADSLSGSVAGAVDTLPDVLDSFTMEAHLLDRVVGTKEERDVAPIKLKEPLMINCGTTTTIGVVTSTKKKNIEVALKLPVCASPGTRVALSRRVGARWRLIGYGIIIYREIMESKEVVIDTNFFMVPFQFNVDIIDELEKALPSYKLTTPIFVINELKGLKRNNKGKIRLNADLALKLANSSNIEIKDISLENNETVDDALLRVSEVLATNDIELKKRARKKGITVAYLRQKKYIAIDGKI